MNITGFSGNHLLNISSSCSRRDHWGQEHAARFEPGPAASSSPVGRVEREAARVDEVRVEQRLPVLSVETRHLDPVEPRVRPVEVPRQPVDGHALGGAEACEE